MSYFTYLALFVSIITFSLAIVAALSHFLDSES
jgi:hypothetical protein